MDQHPFAPSRPGGSVCVAVRGIAPLVQDAQPTDDIEVCGYPAGHPIHEVAGGGEPPVPEFPPGWSLLLRAAIVEHGAACYRRGKADASGMQSAQVAEQRAVRAAMDVVDDLIKTLRGAR